MGTIFLRAAVLPIGLLSLLLLQAGCTSSADVERATADFPRGTGFVQRTINIDSRQYRYTIFVPRTYNPDLKYPAILFLHGTFESGNDGHKQLQSGLAPVIAKNPDAWPFIVIFPQSENSWRGDVSDRLAMTSLDLALTDFNIDADRVILSGFSAGGRGVWAIGANHRERFAALVPFSAVTDEPDMLRLVGVPIWCFHNSADPIVSARASRLFCKHISDAGGSVTYTQFDAFAHDSCASAFAQTEVLAWMLRQNRVSPQASSQTN